MRKHKLLIVDDSKTNREILVRALNSNKFECIEAESAMTALDVIDKEKIELVMLDVNMPEIDGFEALTIIRKKHSFEDLPVVLITALDDPINIERGFNLGANDYITKPIDIRIVKVRVKAILKTKFIEGALKRQAIALKNSRETAINASKAKSQFLSSMSHEIRTPLNALLGNTELLAETNLTEEQKKYIGSVQRAGDTLLRLINNILDLSKIESGLLELEQAEFDLHHLIGGILQIFEPTAKDKKVELEKNIDQNVPKYVSGDSIRVKQILINLIGNALKFTKDGEVSINVKSKSVKNGFTVLQFSVKDTGIGIPIEKVEAVFEEFTQADSSTTKIYGGTGLGLAICKKLVEKMHGKIWLESNEGRGSEFFFTLKLKTIDRLSVVQNSDLVEIDSTPNQKIPKLEDVLSALPNTPTILLTDDSEENRNLFVAFLKKYKMNIIQAKNGQEALDVYKEKYNEIQIVFMDMQMPVMDGYTASKELRTFESKNGLAPVDLIALTAYALKEEQQKSYDAGCNLHLAKPLRKQKLIYTISEILIKETEKVA